MVNTKRTQYTFILIALVLFFSSTIMSVISGISLQNALIDTLLDSLQASYNVIQFSAVTNPLFLIAKLLDAAIFPILTVILATWFFNFINNVNLRERLVLSKVNKLKDHVIVVPYNSFTKSLQQELKVAGIKTVTIVENKRELLQLYKDNELAIDGDLRSLETFSIARISKAMCVVACSKDDVQNAMISITAKTANPDTKIIVRANKEENLDRLERAGAYKTILVEGTVGKEVGEEIAKRLLTKVNLKNN
jgi:voltage-gated potassium channel Kch